jgi:uncharacterized surface protein with fasciclin (FAS1) repeats
MRSNFLLLAAVAIPAMALVGCSDDLASNVTASDAVAEDNARRPDNSGNTILDIALGLSMADEPEFTTLVAAVQAADPSVAELLGAKGKRTVFAPTDAAFDALFSNPDFPFTPAELLGNTELLTTVLLYHVSPGERFSGDVVSSEQVRMLAGGFTFPVVDGDPFLMDGSDITPNAKIVQVDIEASNGVIHVIDYVLVP